MPLKFEFERTSGAIRACEVPTGTLRIVRVPKMGLQGYHKPRGGRTQVLVPTGKVRTIEDTRKALIEAYCAFTGEPSPFWYGGTA